MADEDNLVTVFTGTFKNEKKARDFAFKHTIDEPDDDAGDEEWDEYDDAFLTLLEQEVECHIEPEFVEVIFDEDRLDYLQEKLVSGSDYDSAKAKASSGNCLILVFSGSGVNEDFEVASTPTTVTWVGSYPAVI